MFTTQKPWIIFTDGASSGNPGPGGWGAITISPSGQVLELGGAEAHTTNNRMELISAIQALQKTQDRGASIEVYTDSTYVIRGITQWIWGWKKKGWVTTEGKPVANAELWQQLASQTLGRKVKWNHVRGHCGIPGNERADEIAVHYSKGGRPSLFHGSLENYPISILDLSRIATANAENSNSAKKKSTSPKKAYSYLSCVDGHLRSHATWSDCEKQVQGRSGARYRKATSAEDEESSLKSWGFSLSDLKK